MGQNKVHVGDKWVHKFSLWGITIRSVFSLNFYILPPILPAKNYVNREIKHRIIHANRCFYGFNTQLCSWVAHSPCAPLWSRSMITHRCTEKPWEDLGGKVFRKIFCPAVRLGNGFCCLSNNKLFELLNYIVEDKLMP